MALTFDEDVAQRRAQQDAMLAPPAQAGFSAASPSQPFLAPPPTLGSGLNGMTKPNPNLNFVTGGAPGVAPVPVPAPGRNADGVITAESAQAALGADMQRPGGVFGTMDGKGVNDILARENKARGEMIDSMIQANGGNGVAVLPEASLPGGISVSEWNRGVGTKTDTLGMDPKTKAMYLAEAAQNETRMRGQDMADSTSRYNTETQANASMYGHQVNAQRAAGHDQVLMRGQDNLAAIEAAKLAGNPIDNKTKQLQLDSATQVADLRKQYMAEQDTTKKAALAEQMRVLGGKDKAATFSAIHAAGGTYIDPKNTLQVQKHPDSIIMYNNATGQREIIGGVQPPKPAAPAFADFAAQARAKNPNAKLTDEQLQQAYKQQFGG